MKVGNVIWMIYSELIEIVLVAMVPAHLKIA